VSKALNIDIDSHSHSRYGASRKGIILAQHIHWPRAVLLLGASILPMAAHAAMPDQGQDILVTGQRATSDASSGTKTSTPLVETPQSITVISREEIDLRGVQGLNAALQLTAGVTPDTRGANADVYDQFKLRGFDAPQYLDGLKLFASPTGYANPQIDLSRLDRIEVVKGPASVLYGQSSPGGLIALSSKLPEQASAFGSVAATYGSFDLYRVDADVGGALSADGSTLYRVYGSVNGSDTQQTFGNRRRYTGSGAITLGAGGDTTLTILGSYSHDPSNGNYGSVPRIGSLAANPNGWIARDRADGDPATSRISRNQGAVTYLFDQKLGGGWAFRSRGRYTDITTHIAGAYHTGTPTDATLTTFGRATYKADEHLKNGTFDNQLAGSVQTGAVRHDLLFGADVQVAHAVETVGFGAAPPLDFYHPDYSVPIAMPGPQTGYDVHQRQIGLYAQDQMAIGGLRLTASGRYDWAYGHVRTDDLAALTSSSLVKRDEKFTWRLGALYKLDSGIAPYVSYSTSFEPQGGTVLATGALADPSTGRQFEAGVKYQPPGTAILLSAAYFNITQANVVVSNPISFAATQSGKVRSRGVEFEAKVPVFESFTLTASYSNQRIRTLQDADALNIGRPLIGTANENGGLFGLYSIGGGTLAGLGIGGGVRYVGQGYGGYFNANAAATSATYVTTPAYTLFDGVLTYDLGRANPSLKGLEARINASNIFDKRYLTSCYVNGVEWCWYGSRRTVSATLGYRW
jgi:iron complex outermembrane receptor protein